MTEFEKAKDHKITTAMQYCAKSEDISANYLKDLIKNGRVIIPHNKNHYNLTKFTAIGQNLCVKINTNLGTSEDHAFIDDEIEKTKLAIEYGSDTIMDLSTEEDLSKIRKLIINNSLVPIGTVPIYEAMQIAAKKQNNFLNMTSDLLFSVIEEHAKEGIDFITIHAGITLENLKKYKNESRLTGIVSRGGSLISSWMANNKEENPLYKYYDRLLEMAHEYDVTLSLGDGLRPGSLHDSLDCAQISELLILGELVDRARKASVQVMVEGPGHVPLNEIKTNVEIQKKLTKNAPFYVLGMLPCDRGAGFDHITGAIGGAVAGWFGADMLCNVTASEHLGFPSIENIKESVIAFKLAAHIADIARGNKKALEENFKMSEARFNLTWEEQFKHALFPQHAKQIFEERKSKTNACSMCGSLCAMDRNKEINNLY